MAHSNNPSTSDFNAPESLVADQSVIAWDWTNGLSTTNEVDILIDDKLSPVELPGDAFALVSGAPGTGGPLGSRGQSVPDIQNLLKTGAKSGVAGASQIGTMTNTARKSKQQGSPLDEAEVIILKSSKKRGIVAQKINAASPKRSKSLKVTQADANPKACSGIRTAVAATAETKKNARDFLDDEPDVLILQLKVALVVLKKAVGDYNQAVKERSERREAVAIAKKAKLIACIKEKLVRDFQRATGDASKTLDDLS
ncbi:hypothetical protein B0A48_09863 [Cryoendolithus antarcticus]|uniref:Uncharacterized protein n=1 Tax=Cryoendolithus antarcticus TaxID=1507870 RepID=A0A1V8T370_9PEZI|nr:hypothetical protein B0A48_09863 [Cryoendolithus antarcticus]